MITIEIPTLPPSTNHAYYFGGKGKTFMKKAGKEFKELVRLCALSQMNSNEMLKGRIKVEYEVFYNDKRKRDIDNILKLLTDSLQKVVFENDSQIDELTVKRRFTKEKPRTIIQVEEIE